MTLQETAALAKALRAQIDGVLDHADRRLGPNRSLDTEFDAQADWIWRPEIMRHPLVPPGRAPVGNDTSLGQGLKVFHDSPTNAISVRQSPSLTDPGFRAVLESYDFGGTFLSLVVDLPGESLTDLSSEHILALAVRLTSERPVTSHARLNLRCGPNTQTLVRSQGPDSEGLLWVDFDLSHMGLDAVPISGAWVDLIFDAPDMNAIVLEDLAIVRRPAAQF